MVIAPEEPTFVKVNVHSVMPGRRGSLVVPVRYLRTLECTQTAEVNRFFKKWANPGLFFVYFRLFHITQFYKLMKA